MFPNLQKEFTHPRCWGGGGQNAMVARSSLCPFERRAWNDVPLGANVLSLYQLELIKEGYHNF